MTDMLQPTPPGTMDPKTMDPKTTATAQPGTAQCKTTTSETTTREIEGLVEQWFFEAFHGSVVARATEVWNAVHAAKEELKSRLRELLGEHPAL